MRGGTVTAAEAIVALAVSAAVCAGILYLVSGSFGRWLLGL